MKTRLFLIGLLCLLCPFGLLGQDLVLTDSSPLLLPVELQRVKVYEDADRAHTIASLRARPELFRQASTVNFGYTKGAVWLRLPVDNRLGERAYVQLMVASLDTVVCYMVPEHGDMRIFETGYWHDFSSKDVPIGFPTFELPMGKSEVYICVKGEETIQAPLRVLSASKLLEATHQYDVLSSILVGVVFLMFLYSLLLWLSTGERLYLYYLPLLLVVGVSMLRICGYDQWLIPFIRPYSRMLIPLLSLLSIPFYLEFLNIRPDKYRRLFVMFLFFGGCYLVLLAMILFGFTRESSGLMSLVALLLMPLTLGSAVYVYAKGYRPALYFIMAYSALLVGVATIILASMGVLPYNDVTANALSMGSALQVVLFTLAIADRTNRYRQEAIELQRQALEQAERHAQELEGKVQARTAALQHANEELLASEEELRQNAEELLATNQMLEEQRRKMEEQVAITDAILNSAGLMVITTDLQGTITSFNAKAEEELQYSAGELVGKQSPAIFHELGEVVARAGELSKELGRDIPPGFEVFVAKALDRGIDHREWSYMRKDGSRFPISLTVTPIRAHGDLLGFMGVSEDISLRKEHLTQLQLQQEKLMASEEELRQNLEELQATQEALAERNREVEEKEAQLRQIFNGAPAMIYQFKLAPDGSMSFPLVSKGSIDIYGLPPEVLMADAMSIIGKIHPDDLGRFQQSVMESAQNLTMWKEQLRTVFDDRLIWVEGTSVPERQPDGGTLWSGMVVDIDDRKRMEMELLRQQEELTVKNSALVASEEELRQNAEELLAVNERIAEEKRRAEEALVALKETQNQLVQAEKMSSLGQLTAGVAHEINNPVNFISGGTQTLKLIVKDIFDLLDSYHACELASNEQIKQETMQALHLTKRQVGDVEELKEDAEMLMADIGKGVDRVVEIVGGLKNFSRADDTKEVPADIHEMLDATLIILRNKYKDRIEVVQDYDRSLPPLLCYAGQLNQVFMNIIGNAIDAIDDKGTISIATRKRAENLEISIQDTGKGIPESVKKRIFDPFFTTKPIGQGTGLGLSISYGIVEKHNGSIEVQSVQGKGTEFLVVLPLR